MTNLFPDGDFTFTEQGGETLTERGTVRYPAVLRLELTEAGAWRIVDMLLTQLRNPNLRMNPPVIDVSLVGAIERRNEDGTRYSVLPRPHMQTDGDA